MKYPALTPAQELALLAYAAANGRCWKAALRADWEKSLASPEIHSLRNTHGLMWLDSFRLARIAKRQQQDATQQEPATQQPKQPAKSRPKPVPTNFGSVVVHKNSIRFAPESDFHFRHADKVHPLIRHKGWYIDQYQEEVYRGVAIRLTHGRFAAGYIESSCEYVAIDTNRVHASEIDAALAADDLARRQAEEELDYQIGFDAEFEYLALKDTLPTLRESWRAAVNEIDSALLAGNASPDHLDALEYEVLSLSSAIRSNKARQAELKEAHGF